MSGRPTARIPLVTPDFGTGEVPVCVSLWLVPRGATVLAGDRVVELVAGGVTIDLEAPMSGRLVAQLIDEDEPVSPGGILAEFEAVG